MKILLKRKFIFLCEGRNLIKYEGVMYAGNNRRNRGDSTLYYYNDSCVNSICKVIEYVVKREVIDKVRWLIKEYGNLALAVVGALIWIEIICMLMSKNGALVNWVLYQIESGM